MKHRGWIVLVLMMFAVANPAYAADASAPGLEKATFAGGCFWSMQRAFDPIPGVVSTEAGYTGGQKEHPGYEEVEEGGTGHAESVEVTFDPRKVSYKKLLDVYWHNIDPTTVDRAFCDYGHQYRSVIFFNGPEQEREAKESEKKIEETKQFKDPIVTSIMPASTFWPAEDYHQEFYKKNPARYEAYRYGCGHDQRLRELWGVASGGH